MQIHEYRSFWQKFKGLMFQKNINYGIKLRCNGVHTFFMKENIDIILTDKNNKILYVYQNIKPNKIVWPKKHVYYTYELPINNNLNYQIGDILNK